MKDLININRLILMAALVSLVLVVVFWIWWNRGIALIIDNGEAGQDEDIIPRSSISNISCPDGDRRPIAVMLASDPVARPLFGVAQADIVFEMPVTDGGVTRMMAVFQCENPQKIGSVRSAREDFIPLAGALDAIYVHWGGEKLALDSLNNHITDNIDALKYENIYFYRSKNIKPPHNGFTDAGRIIKGANDLRFRQQDSFLGYPHQDNDKLKNIVNTAESISINYPSPYDIVWTYDKSDKSYTRQRGGEPEIDADNNKIVKAKVVVIMETNSNLISKDYIKVKVSGSGNARIYQDGVVTFGKWGKGVNISDKLYFYDNNGNEINFVSGKIWVEIVTS